MMDGLKPLSDAELEVELRKKGTADLIGRSLLGSVHIFRVSNAFDSTERSGSMGLSLVWLNNCEQKHLEH